MAVIQQVTYVCTTHYKVLDRGVWKTSKWSETRANRHQLILREGICNECMSDARRVLHTQLEARGWTILTTPSSQTAAVGAVHS